MILSVCVTTRHMYTTAVSTKGPTNKPPGSISHAFAKPHMCSPRVDESCGGEKKGSSSYVGREIILYIRRGISSREKYHHGNSTRLSRFRVVSRKRFILGPRFATARERSSLNSPMRNAF